MCITWPGCVRGGHTLAGVGIAEEKYVSFTTFKRDGTAVSTPVWIAAIADGRVGFTTDADVGKVKRLRNNPSVTLRACDLRGKVASNAAAVTGQGVVVTGAQHDEVWRAVRRKYWVVAPAMHVGSLVKGLIGRSSATKTAILITLDDGRPS